MNLADNFSENHSLHIPTNTLREVDIQPGDRVVFVHIPKTGGTSLKTILESGLCGMSAFPSYQLEKDSLSKLEELRKYQLFMGHFRYNLFFELVFPEGFIGITFLRKPASRILSNFRFIQQLFQDNTISHMPRYTDEYKKLQGISLKEFLQLENTSPLVKDILSAQTDYLNRQINQDQLKNIIPTLNQETSLNRRKVETAKDTLRHIAYFGVTEKFQDSLFLLSYTFGWRPVLNQVHLNQTTEKISSNQVNPETLALLQEKSALDEELYHFGTALFDQRYNEMLDVLLSRYGKREHAQLTKPLPPDVMVDLLDQHFIHRRNRRYQTSASLTPQTRQYFLSDRLEGLFGWHAVENTKLGPARWSGPEPVSGFDLPCPESKNIKISLRILRFSNPQMITKLRLSVNGIPVKLQWQWMKSTRRSFLFSAELPKECMAGPFLRFAFSVPQTFAPYNFIRNVIGRSKDKRLLGFCLNWVKVEGYE